MVYADIATHVARLEVRDGRDGRWTRSVCGMVDILHLMVSLQWTLQDFVCAEDDANMVLVEGQSRRFVRLLIVRSLSTRHSFLAFRKYAQEGAQEAT